MIHYKVVKKIGQTRDYFQIMERGLFCYHLLSENRYPTQRAAVDAIMEFNRGIGCIIHTSDENNILNTY
jgi:hypothetical protein